MCNLYSSVFGDLKILSSLILLMFGSATTMYLYVSARRYTSTLLRSVAHYITLFNVLLLGLVFRFYLELNPPIYFPTETQDIIDDLLVWILAITVSVMLWVFLSLCLALFQIKIPPRGQKILLGFMTAFYGVGLWQIYAYNSKPLLLAMPSLIHWILSNGLILEIPLLGGVLWASRSLSDLSTRKMVKGFGLVFLSRYFIILVVVLIMANRELPSGQALLMNVVGLLVFNLSPLVWMRKFFIPFSNSLTNQLSKNDVMQSIFTKHSLTTREREITKVLIDGMSNHEISKALYISHATVKNHVHNIYTKLGVKGRYELVHFFLKSS